MDVFVARHPIFDLNKDIFGYELLYRTGIKNNYFEGIDGDFASSSVIINSMLVIGFKTLTNNKKAFINFTENLIKQEVVTLLPKNLIVLEVLEDIKPTSEIINSLTKLKDLGFTIALDDFIYSNLNNPLIKLADFIKVDFKDSSIFEQKDIIRRIGNGKIKFLAEKIETYEEFERAKKIGYSYFQGYFFSKPSIVSSKDIPSNKLNYMQLIKELNDSEPDFLKISRIIERDVSLSFELLKLVNSSAFSFGNIKSISHAISLLGINEIKKWVYLVTLRKMVDNKPPEIITCGLFRAKFCELIAPIINLHERSSEMFLMGLFSIIDLLLDVPFKDILYSLPLSDDLKECLLGSQNTFRNVLEIALALENVDLNRIWVFSVAIGIDEKTIIKIYYQAIEWANKINNS